MYDPSRHPAKFFPGPPRLEDPISPADEHTAEAEVPAEAPADVELHLGAGPELTACGQPREGLHVTDAWGMFRSAKAGKLATQRRVCPTCESRSVGGPMR